MKLPCFVLLLPAFACAADLTGIITDEGGSPVKGVTVLLPTAGVREGTSPLCPSCYPDCSKMAASGEDGKFVIKGVDDALLFNVLAAAPGYRPACVRGFDPRKGEAKIRLSRAGGAKQAIRGKVVDPEGRPVFGALVEAAGYEKQNNALHFGGFPGDEVAVSDRDGSFELATGTPEITRASVLVNAPQLARAMFGPFEVGAEPGLCRLDRGATVRGRLVRDGRPVPNARIEVAQKDGNAKTYLGRQSIGTDIDGKFELTNVPAGQFWQLSVCRDTLPDEGVAATVPLATAGADTEADLGDLQVERGVTVEGRVILKDGKPVPANTRVLISRENAWDPQTRIPDKDGKFSVVARLGDQLNFFARIKDYENANKDEGVYYANSPDLLVSTENRSFDIVMQPKASPVSDGSVATGVVLTPDGRPAKGANIHLLSRSDSAMVENGKMANTGGTALSVVADDAGLFRIGSSSRDGTGGFLLVLHESGWARVKAEANAEIKLTPWSRVEGVARWGREIPKGRDVKLSFPYQPSHAQPGVFFQAQAKIDAEGKYVIDRAIAGTGRIGVLDAERGLGEGYLQVVGVEIPEAESIRLDLGGAGVSVKGRVEIPEEIRKRGNIGDAVGRLNFQADTSPLIGESGDPLRRFLGEREYQFGLGEDGSFEVRDVLPGTYALSVGFPEADLERPFFFPLAGMVGTRVTVSDGKDDLWVDMPAVQVNAPSLRPGDTLPKFTAATKAGTKVSNESLAGKPSILIFAEGGDDRELAEALRRLPVGSQPVTLFVNPAGVVTEAAASSLVTGKDAVELAKTLGVQIWPSYFIISKDGIVRARERQSDEAMQAIGKVLSGGQ